MLGVSENSVRSPNTREMKVDMFEYTNDAKRDKESPKDCSSLNVNSYMNVFYISYIYKLATSSHAKPGHFEAMSLTWLLAGSPVFPFRKSSYAATSELELQRTPEFRRLPIWWFRRFMTRGLHRFATSGASLVQGFRSSQVRDSRASQVQVFRSSQVRDSGAS
jgi:hypothetical protein